MILVSACLMGKNYRYDGGNNFLPSLFNFLEDKEFRIVCPEVDGGLSIPRPPVEIINGDGFDILNGKARVMTKDGLDFTEKFIKGTKFALKDLKIADIDFAILKAKSPSCGVNNIYNGKFNNKLIKGSGVLAAHLIKNNIKVFTEKNFYPST